MRRFFRLVVLAVAGCAALAPLPVHAQASLDPRALDLLQKPAGAPEPATLPPAEAARPGTGVPSEPSRPGAAALPEAAKAGTVAVPEPAKPGTGSVSEPAKPGTGSPAEAGRPATAARPDQPRPPPRAGAAAGSVQPAPAPAVPRPNTAAAAAHPVTPPKPSAPAAPAPPQVRVPLAPPPAPVLPPPLIVPTRPPAPPSPAPVAADAPGAAAQIPDGLRVTFGESRADLNPGTETALRTLAHAAPGDAAFTVAAFAPGAPEDPSTPRRLSLSRALTVRSVLIAEGVASVRIYVKALGPGPGLADGPADRVDVTVAATNPQAR